MTNFEEYDTHPLPETWEWKKISNIGDIVLGTTPSTSNKDYYGDDYPFYKPTSLNAGYYTKCAKDGLSDAGMEEARYLPPKSTLVTCIGSTIGKTGFLRKKGASNQQIIAVVPRESMVPEYVYFVVNSTFFQSNMNMKKSATTTPILNKGKFSELPIPVPPYNEQRRIVAKIEELFSKLDSGVSELEKSQDRLDLYKKATLNEALEEGFSEEIYQEEAGEVKARENIEEIDAPDNAPLLPETWKWVHFEDVLSEPLRNGKSARQSEEGIRTLTLEAVTKRDFSEKNTKITEANPEKVDDLWLEAGDLLVERSSGTTENVGLSALYRGEDDYAIFPDLMIRARVEQSNVTPQFAEYMLHTPFHRNYLINTSKGSSGMSKINQGHLRNMPFPLPSIAEQQMVVEKLDHVTSIIDRVSQDVTRTLERADILRQSILKNAFSGNLVGEVVFEEEQENTKIRAQATLSEVTSDVE